MPGFQTAIMIADVSEKIRHGRIVKEWHPKNLTDAEVKETIEAVKAR